MWIYRLMLPLLPVISCHLLTHPENQATIVGRRVTFHCQTNVTNRSIHWMHTPVNKQLATDITRHSRKHSFNSTAAAGDSYLTILSVTLQDAGAYACIDRDGFGTAYGVDLVVLPSSPSCESNVPADGVVDGDMVEHTCRFSFSGNLEPVTRWVTQNVAETATCQSESNSERVCRKSIRVSTTSDVLIANIFALGFMAKNKTSGMFSVNNVTSVYRWTSPEVAFLFPVSHVRVNVTAAAAAAQEVMYVGQSIRCSSRGRPPASFTWQRINSTSGFAKNVSSDSILKLIKTGQQVYRCCAENVIRGSLNIAVSETITIDVKSPNITKLDPRSIQSRGTMQNISFNISEEVFEVTAQTGFSANQTADIDSLVTSFRILGSSHVNESVTERVTPVYEMTLFVSTLALGSILFLTLVFCCVRLIYRKTKKRPPTVFKDSTLQVLPSKAVPEGYYLTLTDDSSTKYPPRNASTSSCSVYVNDEDVYEEIDENQVIDDLDDVRYKKRPQREPMQDPVDYGITKQSLLYGTNLEFSKGDKIQDFVGFESNYITCPGLLKTTN